MNRKLLNGILFLLALGVFYYFGYYQGSQAFKSKGSSVTESSQKSSEVIEESPLDISPKNDIPARVYEILKYIDEHNKAPEGYVGGRHFGNFEKLLPNTNKLTGSKIKYREWDVNPKTKGKNRGVERLVTGNNESAYYTKDHYKSFKQIR